MADLMTMALACDLTRVFTFQFSAGVDFTVYSEAGVNGAHHQLTHDEGGEQPNVQKICVFIMQQFAYFAEQLAKVQEGATTLLDNCSILGTSDCAQGLQHSLTDYPLVVLGAGGGKIKTGIHYRSTGENTSSAVLSIARSSGAAVPRLGAVTAGLPAIEA
jgi:hypothetical protein